MITEESYIEYLERLIRGDQGYCMSVVNDLLDAGVDVRTLYVDLFQRSLYQVGELWEKNHISVATEHLATAITERLMTLVYPAIFAQEHLNHTAVVGCTPNEYHQVGGRMVADILELNRWHGYFLGANTPIPDLLALIQQKDPDLLALSMSIYFNMGSLIETLDAVRHDFPDLPILLGGQAFLWGGHDIVERHRDVQLLGSLGVLEELIQRWD